MNSRNGIRIIGISSDGDHRLLASMIYETSNQSDYKFVQDTTHIATKLRNRALKPSIVLPLGNKQISVAHLKILIKSVPKIIHGLTITDVDPKDRQNYASYEKITSRRVLDALSKHVVDSEGTIKYLEICNQITSTFLQHDLTPLERVYRIWNAVYFFRIWYSWIKSTRVIDEQRDHTVAYKIKDNFITSNCHKCIEINAKSLISLMKRFRDENAHERFLPTLFDSQTCEKMFRHFRSMGTANFTKINFTMFEILNMVRRVEIKNEIEQYKLADVDIVFPRSNRSFKTKTFILPSDEKIEQMLTLAKSHAIDEAKQFEMIVTPMDIDEFEFPVPKFMLEVDQSEEEDVLPNSDDDTDSDSDGCLDEIGPNVTNQIAIFDQCADEIANSELDENSIYTLVRNEKGDLERIRKSALVWALSAPSSKLSNDRLNRVKAHAQKVFTDEETTHHTAPNSSPIIMTARTENGSASESYAQNLDIINIGDWCFFQGQESEQILFGVVLQFQYSGRKAVKDKFYAADFVSLSTESKSNVFESLCTFYRLGQDGSMSSFQSNHFFINLSNYIATLVGITPIVHNAKRYFNSTDFEILRENLEQIKKQLQ